MRRSSTSDGPAALTWKPSAGVPPEVSMSNVDWVFGPVMDVSLDIEQVRPFPMLGESTGFVRVAIRNTGPWAIEQVNFGYCQDLVPAPFELDNSFPGGCAEAGLGPTCLAVGEPPVQFSVVDLAPGETKSCLLRATTREPLIGPVRFGVSMVEDVYVAGDELLHDFDDENDHAVMQIAPTAPPSHPVPLSTSALAVLMATLLASGAAAARRYRP